MEVVGLTDIGRMRENNEDNYFTYFNDNLIGGLVADGMGGHNAGEIASKIAVDTIKQFIIEKYNPKMDFMELSEVVRMAFNYANSAIFEKAKRTNNTIMGTTATLALIYQKKLILAHVGDSRCYKIEGGIITQLTNDHSYVAELLKNGHISESVAKMHPNRNMITRALGSEIGIKIDINILDYKNQIIILTSDGLTNMLSDEQIKNTVILSDNLENATTALVELANKKGGNDNITVVAFGNLKGETEK
ncbi:MAG: Stp1/IreP family PP2C-type Ser/Thr phosphatase [Clostridia bacterium]|nr:Stp1/IreP family PP2C-type Ser/Thr phosphatase [Clostridia bacterium]